jgi:hypothetical protein
LQTLERLIKFNAWYAFACGIFSLVVAPMLVNEAVVSMGVMPERIYTNETYVVAVTFVRCAGVLFLTYTFLIRMLLKSGFDLRDLRKYFTLLAVGVLLWGGILLLVVTTKSIWLNIVAAIGLLEWLISPVWMIFNYNQSEEWKSVKPGD